MNTDRLAEIERQIDELAAEERLWLIERLARGLRSDSADVRMALEQELAEMAADPDIQRELRDIAEDFSATETDGLEQLR
jgi:hypothetical protein